MEKGILVRPFVTEKFPTDALPSVGKELYDLGRLAYWIKSIHAFVFFSVMYWNDSLFFSPIISINPAKA